MTVSGRQLRFVIALLGIVALVLILSPVFDAREYIRQVWLLSLLVTVIVLEALTF